MKSKILLFLALFLVGMTAFAMQESGAEASTSLEAGTLLEWLTLPVVFIVGLIVKVVKPLIPGWLMLAILTLSSTAITAVTQLTENPELSWLEQFAYGLLAIVVSQFFIQIKKAPEDNAKLSAAKK